MKELKARDGYYLTQNSDNVENRIFVTAIKGMNISELDWREATVEEKEEYENGITTGQEVL
jgi:predicted GTPase